MTDSDAKETAKPFKMVVGVETDDTGDNAIEYAIDLAKRFGGELHVCHPSKSNTEDPDKIAALLDATLEKLKTFLADTIQEAGLAGHTTLHPGLGEPAKVLEQLAIDVEADLIIVGTHGRRGMRRLVQGSVANQLVLSAPCPVAVAIPRKFEGLEKSPSIEPAPPHARSHIRHPHAYHYRRSIRFSNVDANINPTGMQSRGF